MVTLHDDIARAIAQKDTERAVRLLFERGTPVLRLGRSKETDLWDFKSDTPDSTRDANTENGWAHVAADVLAFHNHRGGLLIFGIDDKTYKFVGATRALDSKRFNDRLRRYTGDLLWVDFHREHIQDDQRYLGVALIPPRGPVLARFKADAPLVGGRRLFVRNGSALRQGDSTHVLDVAGADQADHDLSVPSYGERYAVDRPYFRVLAPEYSHFLPRDALARDVGESLRGTRVAVTSLIGAGGMGKTALATWTANRCYDDAAFDFIVSTTAKDRELSGSGILGLKASLTSYEDLLDQILDVLGEPEGRADDLATTERNVRDLIGGTKGLLYVDNLETVDDSRLIGFLDNLPDAVTALVTSRRNSVRVASRPVEIPPLTDSEVVAYVELLAHESALSHLGGMRPAEALKFGRAWDGIPLALRWAAARTKSVPELLSQAEVPISQRMYGDQLLEFSFRRIFDRLSPAEKAVLEALSIIDLPLPAEALVAASGQTGVVALDAAAEMLDDGIVHRVFDSDRNDYCFTVLPITRAFTRADLRRRPGVSSATQRRLSNWYEASDVKSADERLVVREIRSGRNADDGPLVDLATGAVRRGDLDAAERLYAQALTRNPRSWRAAREAAEFWRHSRQDSVEALRLYEMAGANAPKQGADRALIFREWGILLRDSGVPDAAVRAEERLLIAFAENSTDAVTRHVLASCYDKRGAYRKVIELLEPVADTSDSKTRAKTLPYLLRAYEMTSELVKAAELRVSIARS